MSSGRGTPRRSSVRTCIGCRERAEKLELLRVVVGDRGAGREVVPDPAGRAPGRGAHLHPTPECLELAVRRRAFPRALRSEPGLATTAVEEFVRTTAGAQQHQQDQQHPAPSSNIAKH
jgi:predicted RNA-binding protein YlxR (DUF448 family)